MRACCTSTQRPPPRTRRRPRPRSSTSARSLRVVALRIPSSNRWGARLLARGSFKAWARTPPDWEASAGAFHGLAGRLRSSGGGDADVGPASAAAAAGAAGTSFHPGASTACPGASDGAAAAARRASGRSTLGTAASGELPCGTAGEDGTRSCAGRPGGAAKIQRMRGTSAWAAAARRCHCGGFPAAIHASSAACSPNTAHSAAHRARRSVGLNRPAPRACPRPRRLPAPATGSRSPGRPGRARLPRRRPGASPRA